MKSKVRLTMIGGSHWDVFISTNLNTKFKVFIIYFISNGERMRKKQVAALIIVVIIAVLSGIYYYCIILDRSLSKVMKAESITLITTYGPTTYYKYRESEMGFEYELAEGFAEFLGVKLNVIVVDWADVIPMLKYNKGDFIGNGMTVTPERMQQVVFSNSYMDVKQHIISHKNKRLYNIKSLDNKTITIRENSSYEERLNSLLQQDNNSFHIELVEDVPTELLIEMVNNNSEMITVADSHVALRVTRFYPNIRVRFAITDNQTLAWATKTNGKELRSKMNEYINKSFEDGFMSELKNKYFSNPEICDCYDAYKFHERLRTRLPKYEKMIKKEAEKYGFDWRKITAIIYQESHFDRYARSHTGVRGLMQLTKDTAERMGVHNRLDPSQSIMGGVKYLSLLYKRYENIDDYDRMNFTLASYNVGPGHVRDAMVLAKELGLDPDKWMSIRKSLPLLARKTYYKKSKYGYTRGWEGVAYVDHVNKYYDILQMYEINKNMAEMMIK